MAIGSRRWATLAQLAARAAPQVYPVLGRSGRAQLQRLRLRHELVVSVSPRHACVLLVIGELAPCTWPAALLLHDQLPEPRGVVVWSDDPGTRGLFAGARHVACAELPLSAAQRLQRDLLTGQTASSPARLPAENPVAWRGVGPHGQGGEGMMGGKPYGRPMTMKGPDLRDGLALDRSRWVLGPFLPFVPPGLELELELQGSEIQQLRARSCRELAEPDLPAPFREAERQPVRVATLERARARHLLGACAELLWLHGLDGWSERLLRLAAHDDDLHAAQQLAVLRRRLRRSALPLSLRGVGKLPAAWLSGMGPLARAAGVAEDARSLDSAYAGLGFELVTQRRGDTGGMGDVEARFFQRLCEAEQARQLAARAGERLREPGAPLETPRGRADVTAERWSGLLSQLAVGSSWDAFATSLVSLDLDPARLPVSDDYGAAHVEPSRGADDHERDTHQAPAEPRASAGIRPTRATAQPQPRSQEPTCRT